MFYLLENNRIIDSENYKEPYIWSKDVIRNREVLFLIFFKAQVLVKGPIKKQSENVLDLIEEGDLIKLSNTLNQVTAILEEGKKRCFEIGENRWFSEKRLNNYINAKCLVIYKPNSNGDYVKVWEKKDD